MTINREVKRRAGLLGILLSCLVLGGSFGLRAQGEGALSDLGPTKGWHTAGAIQLSTVGQLYLARDGKGSAWKSVQLNVDEFPFLQMCVMDSTTMSRGEWTMLVQKADATSPEGQGIPLFDKKVVESFAFIPLKKITGWSGTVKFKLILRVEGPKGDWVGFDDLAAVRFTDAKPPAPKLEIPSGGSSLSRLALHFCWFQTTNAAEYELEVAPDPEFAKKTIIRTPTPYLGDKLAYLPEDRELLPPGKWFWRVRARNAAGGAGDWSDTREFTVKEAARPRAPQLSVSTVHPLMILYADGGHLVENWNAVPDELKPYSVLRVEATPTEKLRPVLETAQRNGIPLVFQASGPRDYYQPGWFVPRLDRPVASRIPLPEIEQIFLDFPVVKGVYICEQAIRKTAVDVRIQMNYAERLLPLAAEYGRSVVWADAHWGRNIWMEVGLNQKFFDTIREYHEYLFPVWKMNGALTPYSAHDATMGLWVSRAVDNWGVQPEVSYWGEAGLQELDQQSGHKEGKLEAMPPAFYGQMILLGLSSGATVYSLEPSPDIWGKDGGLSETAQGVTFPLLANMIRHRWIPSREQVLEKIRCVYVADEPDLRWSLDYGTMKPVYEATYGLLHPFQLIPATGRYYWLPIVPKWTPAAILKTFPRQLDARTFPSSKEAKVYLDKAYPRSDESQAWVVHVGDLVTIMNSRENWDVEQEFEVALPGKIQKMAGRLRVNSYVVAQPSENELRIQVNGRPDRSQLLEFVAAERPGQVAVEPPGALETSSWDPGGRRLTMKLFLDQGAVDVKMTFPAGSEPKK